MLRWAAGASDVLTIIWIADAHRGDGKRFVVHADEKLTAVVELEAEVRAVIEGESRKVSRHL
jgi:hypothetical protein